MSGKGKKRRAGFYGDNYFQSSAWNQRTYAMYRNWIYAIALTRFKWVNLPPTCNERYLEWTLLNQGVATIAFPKKQPGVFYSTITAHGSHSETTGGASRSHLETARWSGRIWNAFRSTTR